MQIITTYENITVTVDIKGSFDTYTYDDICQALDNAKFEAERTAKELELY